MHCKISSPLLDRDRLSRKRKAQDARLFVRKCSGRSAVWHRISLSLVILLFLTLPGVSRAAVAPTPSFSPTGGTYTSVKSVSIICSNTSATIYYTTDGSTPTTSSPIYSSPITVSTNETIKAIATVSGYTVSAVGSATYVIKLPAATPTFSPVPGKYTSAQSVSISDSTSGATIYYTTNGTTPTTSSTPYTGPITVSANETIEAVAVSSSTSLSAVAKGAYTIAYPAATPVISPGSGTYASGQSVTLSDSTSGAVIYYTVNGSTPNTSSTQYTGPISVSTDSTIQAIALAPGGSSSPKATATLNFSTATPTISPAGGTYTTVQKVTLASATSGASIYYTTNGTTPTTSSNYYGGAFTVSANTTVKAMAIAKYYVASSVSAATFTIKLPAATPTFSVASGTYLKTQSVSIYDSTSGAVIYYTTDGSTPTTSSAIYSGALTVAKNETIKAMALASGGSPSPVASASYTITPPAATPTFSPIAGKYTSVQSVTISDATSGAAIYYTTDGTTPTTSSKLYTGPITVGATQTIEAVAIASGGSLSPIGKAGYTIVLPTAVPVISPASGTYSSVQSVTITDATAGAVIYYTVNGSYPTTSSPVYSGPITATTNTTIQAIALAPNDSASGEAKTQYTIVTPAPAITPASGTFNYTASVSMSDSAAGATIYYTMNGSTPTTSSPVYSGPITLTPTQTTTTTFNAIAVAPGSLQSSAVSGSVTVTLPSGVLAESVVSTTPQKSIPADFMGLSTDWTQPTAMMGQASTGANTAYYQLLKNLTQYLTAPMLLRIEGDNSTVSNLQPDIEPLVELAQHVNVKYTLGVDLMNDNLSVAQAQAAQWASGIPNSLIYAFEIGNEPDLYPYSNSRPSTYDFSSYLTEFQQWQQGVLSSAGTGFTVMGPSIAGSQWNSAAESGLSSGTFSAGLISQHAYLGGAAAGQTLPADYLLIPTSATQLPTDYAPFAASAHTSGAKFRMGEINSIGGGGASGISNTFQSTLWSIDIMFNYLANGMDGVNWHTGQYTPYALFEFKPQPLNNMTVFNLTQVNPLYYGLWAFAQVAGKGAKLLPVHTMTDSNVSIWATVDSASVAHMVVINKDETATGKIQISLPGYSTGTVRYITAPSYSSTNGVKFGGLTFDGSTDGTPSGTPVSSTITGTNGMFTLGSMPITTAAVIDFTN